MGNIIYLSDFLKNRFGRRVHKVSFRLNNTCPNRDGKISSGGCIFCNGQELVPFSYKKGMSPCEQIKSGIEIVRRKYKAEKFIAYLQDNTGTYGDEENIMDAVREVIKVDGVAGVSIGTRADCISDRFYRFFEELSKETFLMVEIGVQSINEKTLNIINRGHDVRVVEETFKRLSRFDIHTVAHIILGLMNDTEDDIRRLSLWMGDNMISGVKIHNIVVLKDTPLQNMYLSGEFVPPSEESLLRLYEVFFRNLKNRIVVHRLTTDAGRRFIVAPDYAADKSRLLSEIRNLAGKYISQ